MARKSKHTGIGSRMAAFTISVGLSVMLVIAIVRGTATVRQIDRLFSINLESQADAYESAIEAALWVRDMKVVKALVDGIGNSRLVARAAVIEDGAVLHESISDPELGHLTLTRELNYRLLDQDMVIGSLVIHGNEREFRREIVSWLLLELPLDLAAAVLIGAVLYGYVKRRLADRLRADADAIAAFDLRDGTPLFRGSASPDDEITELERGFDRMSAVLRSNFIDLDKAQKALSDKLDERTLLIRELFHRTRNNMQTILAFLSIESSRITDERLKEPFRILETRIHAMAIVHQMLADGTDLNVIELGPYLTQLTILVTAAEDFALRGIATVVHTPPAAETGFEDAIPLGLALTELLANVARHCIPIAKETRPDPGLRIVVDGRNCGGERRTIIIRFEATVDPENAMECLYSFPHMAVVELDLVRALVEGQLNGTFSTAEGADGALVFQIEYTALRYTPRV
jgi:two-component sensor histidine kinase